MYNNGVILSGVEGSRAITMKTIEQKAKKVPAIRFAGFEDEWVEKKLSESLILLKDGTHGTHQDAENGPLLLSAKNIKNGSVNWDESDRRISQEEYDQIHSTFNLKKGDVLLTIVGSIGESAVLKNVQGITFQRSVAFLRPNENLLSDYLCTKIQTTSFQKELDNRKSTSAQPGIYLGDLSQIPFIIASQKEEQQKIGSFFSNIDSLISLEQKKYDKLTQVKKSMLEKMFPKEGATVPEIRFAGFTGEWEKKKLGDMGTTYTGLSGKTKSDFGHGMGRFVTYMNVFLNPVSDPNRTEAVEIDNTQNTVQHGDVFFTTSSETPEEVGMSSVWLDKTENIYLNSFCFGYRPTENIDPFYLAYMLRSNVVRKKITYLAQGISRYNISKNGVMEIEVPLPNFKEQQKIGSYFSHLDSLISLQQRKLEKLKNIKKSLLEKMFV